MTESKSAKALTKRKAAVSAMGKKRVEHQEMVRAAPLDATFKPESDLVSQDLSDRNLHRPPGKQSIPDINPMKMPRAVPQNTMDCTIQVNNTMHMPT